MGASAAARQGSFAPACADAAAAYHVALVVEHAAAQPGIRSCFDVGAASSTAQQVLDTSGVPYRYVDEGSNGRAVCQVQNEPAGTYFDRNNCFSGSGDNVGRTWNIFCSSPWQHLSDGSPNQCYSADGSWQYSSHGISSLELRDGDAVGFKYEGAPARPVSAAGICPPVSGDRAPPPTGGGSPAPSPTGANGSPRVNPAASGTRSSGARASTQASAPIVATGPAPADPPTAAPGGSLSAEAQAIAPTPGFLRTGHPSLTRTDPGAARWVGPVAAAAAGLLLLVALGAQVVLPRMRR